MASPKGQTNNPLGYAVGTGKPLSDALRIALQRPHTKSRNGKPRATVIAERVAKAAADGEVWAIGVCFDRTEGKPMQPVEAKVDLMAGMTDEQIERELRALLLALGLAGESDELTVGASEAAKPH